MRSMISLQPLGDQALLAHFADEQGALSFTAAVRRLAPAWLLDVVQAYASVAVFFDPDQVHYAAVAEHLEQLRGAGVADLSEGRVHCIPCCYELQLDLRRVAEHTGLAAEEVI